MPAPSLLRREPEGAARALVLMLHGGRADGHTPVDERSTSWRRSRWMLGQIEGRLTGAGAAVWLLRYSVRGWNQRTSSTPSPVLDARWALEEVRRDHADVPVVLLGHSMGARTAVAVADDPQVTGVVGLAPWLPANEPNRTLSGRHLAAAHGRSDKITSISQTAAFVERAERVAASTELVDMGAVGHYMFRRIPAWNAFAVSRSLAFAGVADRSRD
ncbi:MAG TPA: alpha/beta fold hydrolase [Nocardioides sp.]|uniref:alpha/beta hydrolase n=1 Tax=Nocardioides sp. TaxID=35761 RepID=UPI002D806A5A|nr:alpha/beta fold hydrolase [Nocardioides sp.]HET6651113.1 alpha/beta fold hydrolase [Nocardioides sp.]